VGNPARIIVGKQQVMDEKQAEREATATRMGFSAYGVTEGDDPLSQALKGLIDNAGGHEHQIALLWQAVEKLAACAQSELGRDCMPSDAQKTEHFDAEGLNRLVK
jgi:serine O-acetyltransferase